MDESRIPRSRDVARYPRRAVQILIDGLDLDPDTWTQRELPNWMELRGWVERTGNLDAETFATVIDLERSLAKLASRHPEGAVVLAVIMMLDLDAAELAAMFGPRRNWIRVANKSVAWLSIDMSGGTTAECELAWKHAR